METEILAVVLPACAGALVGVGITGAADHFSRNQSLWPVPICPHCGHVQTAASMIPIVGPILGRGRCNHCEQRAAWLLAAIVQLLAAALGVMFFNQFGLTLRLATACVEGTALMAVGVVDVQHRLIPTLLVYPTVAFAVVTSPLWPGFGLLSSMAGCGIGFGLFFILAVLARLAFGEGALGSGDVTLAALIGAICGFPLLVLALAVGAVLGGLGAVGVLVLRRTTMGATMPYGPYLVAGVLYVMISGYTLHPITVVVSGFV